MFKAVRNFANKTPVSVQYFSISALCVFNVIMSILIIAAGHSFAESLFFGAIMIFALTMGAFFFCFGLWQSIFDYIKVNPIEGHFYGKPFVVKVPEKNED